MSVEFLREFFAPVIVGVCLCAGFVIKRWVADVENKYIPTLCAALGVAMAVWGSRPHISPEILLTGLFSGLAATGLYEAFKNLLGGA